MLIPGLKTATDLSGYLYFLSQQLQEANLARFRVRVGRVWRLCLSYPYTLHAKQTVKHLFNTSKTVA